MRYKPVVIAQVVSIKVDNLKQYTRAQLITKLTLERPSDTESYWQVRSKLLGDCGHKHQTIEEAQPCYEWFCQVWTREHRTRSKKGWEKRRARMQKVSQ